MSKCYGSSTRLLNGGRVASMLLFFAFISGLFGLATPVFAGFGITPPYVRNASLTRNSRFEQEIILVRSDPLDDLVADVSMDIPKAGDWVTIDRGQSFTMAKGLKQVPMKVRVNVPKDAPFGTYKGAIRVRVSPAGGTERGRVGIALGAQIDVDITIIDKEIIDFKVQRIKLSDLNEGHKKWWMYFPGKIKFTMQVENTGNVPSTPSKVQFDIYDFDGTTLLETTKNTNTLAKIQPFETGDVLAELPTRLAAGNYKITYRIYNGDAIVQEGKLDINILPYGTLPDDQGYGLAGLSLRDKAILMLLVALGAAVIAALCIVLVRFFRRKRRGGGSAGNGAPGRYYTYSDPPTSRRRV